MANPSGIETNYTDTSGLVTSRFAEVTAIASTQLTNVATYITNIEQAVANFGTSLPAITDLEAVVLNSPITPINYNDLSAAPVFADRFTTLFDGITEPVLSSTTIQDDIDSSGIPSETLDFNENVVTELSAGTDITADALEDINDVDLSFFEYQNFDFVENTLAFPDVTLPEAPGDMPTLNSIEIPAQPPISWPDANQFLPTDITIPTMPGFETFSWDITPPTLDVINTPTGFSYTEKAYNSSIWTDLFSKVLSDIQNGGTGLDATVEADIYARGRERQTTENERLYQQTLDAFGASGFNLPTGAFAAQTAEVLSDISRKNDLINYEITINQADLAQKNTQFAISLGADLEKMLRDFFHQQANRSLEAKKVLAQSGIDIFNALVTKYNIQLEGYKTEASVFESRIKSELVKAEMYKTQMEGAKVEAEVQRNQIQVYQTWVAIIDSMVKIYAIELENAKLQSDIERNKIDTYRAQVEAYTASIQAENTKIQGYLAVYEVEKIRADVHSNKIAAYATQLDAGKKVVDAYTDVERLKVQNNAQKIDKYKADISNFQAQERNKTDIFLAKADIEKTKAGIYGEKVKAYATKVGAETTKVNTVLEERKIQIATNAHYIEQYKAELSHYQAKIDTEAKLAGFEVDSYKAEIDAYNASVDAFKAQAMIKIEELKADIDSARLNIDKQVAILDAELKNYVAINDLALKGEDGALNVSAQLAASALNAVNASASMNFGGSGSKSVSYNGSFDYEDYNPV